MSLQVCFDATSSSTGLLPLLTPNGVTALTAGDSGSTNPFALQDSHPRHPWSSAGRIYDPAKPQGKLCRKTGIKERRLKRATGELESDKAKAEYQWGAPLGKDDNGIRQPGDTKANLLPQPGNALADPNKGNPIALRDSQLLASRIKNLQNATSIPEAQKKLAIDDVKARITDPVAWQKAMLKLALLPTQSDDDQLILMRRDLHRRELAWCQQVELHAQTRHGGGRRNPARECCHQRGGRNGRAHGHR